MATYYHAHDYAGCVSLRHNRQTGTEIGVYNADQAGYDPAGGPWAVVCHSHNWILNVHSLEMARYCASHPLEWCEYCNGVRSPEESV